MSNFSLLKTEALTKEYSTRVLDGVAFELYAGEIHGLLGANGAGKSTLCKIIAGLLLPTSGTMQLCGSDYIPSSKQAAENAGVQIVQQELNLIATLSVAENIFLNRLPSRFGIVQTKQLQERARKALDRFGLVDITTDALVSSLGVGQQQMLEIASALDRNCRLLILDEPTAALSATETRRLFTWLHELRQRGIGIIYISHRLSETAEITDRVTILRDGKHVATYATKDVTTHRMVELMSGKQHSPLVANRPSYRQERIALRVENLTRLPQVKNISFSVHRGERLGISGLVGSGRTELVRAIFGADLAESGFVFLGDDPSAYRFSHPSQAVKKGLVMVTEDRKQDGLLLSQPIRVNTTLANMQGVSRAGLLSPLAECTVAQQQRDSLDFRCTDIEQAVGTLSGGNQQKVAIAKWLYRDGEVFLFDEPTRGIDMAARQKIYQLLETLASQGKAIIIVSSDLEELMDMCDRIGVMSAGEWKAEFERCDFSEEKLTQAAFSSFIPVTA